METPVIPAPETAAPAAAPAATPAISMEAFNKLKGCFDAPRWAKIEAQAAKQSEDLPALCTRLAATSAARYPDNDLAASYSAANRLLISLGSMLKEADVKRFETALNPDAAAAVTTEAAPAVTPSDEVPAPAPKKRGGKAEPAPPPAN